MDKKALCGKAFEKCCFERLKRQEKSYEALGVQNIFQQRLPPQSSLCAIVETTLSARSQSECCEKNRRQIRHEHGHSHSNARALKVLIRAPRPPANFFHRQFAFSPSSGRSGRACGKAVDSVYQGVAGLEWASFSQKIKRICRIREKCAFFCIIQNTQSSDIATIFSMTHDWRQNYASDKEYGSLRMDQFKGWAILVSANATLYWIIFTISVAAFT